METVSCRTCGQSVTWVRTDKDKSMPVDARPSNDGNVLVLPSGRAVVFGAPDSEYMRTMGHDLRKSHFVTCANPPESRR